MRGSTGTQGNAISNEELSLQRIYGPSDVQFDRVAAHNEGELPAKGNNKSDLLPRTSTQMRPLLTAPAPITGPAQFISLVGRRMRFQDGLELKHTTKIETYDLEESLSSLGNRKSAQKNIS